MRRDTCSVATTCMLEKQSWGINNDWPESSTLSWYNNELEECKVINMYESRQTEDFPSWHSAVALELMKKQIQM